jgi:hypothetical protein
MKIPQVFELSGGRLRFHDALHLAVLACRHASPDRHGATSHKEGRAWQGMAGHGRLRGVGVCVCVRVRAHVESTSKETKTIKIDELDFLHRSLVSPVYTCHFKIV